MKRLLLLIVIILLSSSVLYSKPASDTLLVEKEGWLVYYLGHAIWFESNLTGKINNSSFFTSDTIYKNGLIVDYLDNTKIYKSISKCYLIKVLLQTDSVTKTASYISEENICILPVKAKVRLMPNTEPFEEAGVSFKRKKNEVTIVYWSSSNYFVVSVVPLHKKDKKRIKKRITKKR